MWRKRAVNLLPHFLNAKEQRQAAGIAFSTRNRGAMIVLAGLIACLFYFNPERPPEMPTMAPVGISVALLCGLRGARAGAIAVGCGVLYVLYLVPPLGVLEIEIGYLPWMGQLFLSWVLIPLAVASRGGRPGHPLVRVKKSSEASDLRNRFLNLRDRFFVICQR